MSRWLSSLARRVGLPTAGRRAGLCSLGRRLLRIAKSGDAEQSTDLLPCSSSEAMAAHVADALAVHDKGEHWTVLLDPGMAPLLEVESTNLDLDEPAWHALAEHRFASILGDTAERYRVALERFPRASRLACAFPAALVQVLLNTSIHRSGRLSIVPALAHAHSVVAGTLTQPHWIVCVTDETCQAAWCTEDRLHLGAPFPASTDQPLHDILKREADFLGIGDSTTLDGRVVLIGRPHASLRSGWSDALMATDAMGQGL